MFELRQKSTRRSLHPHLSLPGGIPGLLLALFLVSAIAGSAIAGSASAGAGDDCSWTYGFQPRDLGPGDVEVRALTVWDDGQGESLYAAGDFTAADAVEATGIARWDGTTWWPLLGTGGEALEGSGRRVAALVAWDDGDGDALYAGGRFTTADGQQVDGIARWDGSAWTPLTGSSGTGVAGEVEALAVWDDGTGEALYVGGDFNSAGGVDSHNIARWDGDEWSALAADGLSSRVDTLLVWHDGTQEALYLGGTFSRTEDDSVALESVARWDGTEWSPLQGSSGIGANEGVSAMVEWRGLLVIGGELDEAGGLAADYLATWDGSEWAPLAAESVDSVVNALWTWGSGADEALYVGGYFTNAGATAAMGLARWDGKEWTAPDGDLYSSDLDPGSVHSLRAWDDGRGEVLYLAGDFVSASGRRAGNIATWGGETGTEMDPFPSTALSPDTLINDFEVWDDGQGKALYAGGALRFAGDTESIRLARWNGARWSTVGEARISGNVHDVEVWQGDLYIAGSFRSIGELVASRVARWDGKTWTTLEGPSGEGTNDIALELEVWDDGDGEALYVGGGFDQAGGLPAENIARWDGSDWAALAGGLDDRVFALEVWDDGGGEDLYVGGRFVEADGITVNRVARWDGAAWSQLAGSSGVGIASGYVKAIETFDGDLYLGGDFASAGGVSTRAVARWDGTDYFPLPEGDLDGFRGRVETLHAHDDGTGLALYVAGSSFTSTSGVYVGSIGRWTGTEWQHLDAPDGEDPRGGPVVLTSFDAGYPAGGPALFGGGRMTSGGGIVSSSFGMWACDGTAPSPPTVDSPTHGPNAGGAPEITLTWQGASDTGAAGLHGYSYLLDIFGDSEPDPRLELLHEEGSMSVVTDAQPEGIYHFHLRTCDRRRNCATSHLGPLVVGTPIFFDGFESGDPNNWSTPTP